MRLDTHLNFNGTCEAAFEFYVKVLGGQILFKMTHGESPMADQFSPDWQNKIMHATLMVGDRIIMGSDAPPGHYKSAQGMSLSISLPDPVEAARIFHALAESGTVQLPIQKTFWSTNFGMLTDQFGIPWMLNCEQPAS